MPDNKTTLKEGIEQVVCQIPYGKVISYGRVAQLLDMQFGIQTSGWMVGRLMHGILSEPFSTSASSAKPRWRVVNKQGYISTHKLGHLGLMQQQLLESEGVEILNNTVDMKKYGWSG